MEGGRKGGKEGGGEGARECQSERGDRAEREGGLQREREEGSEQAGVSCDHLCETLPGMSHPLHTPLRTRRVPLPAPLPLPKLETLHPNQTQ